MTPKEKAIELYDKFHVWDTMNNSEVKKMASIAVDEVLQFIDERMQGWLDADWVSYWKGVKKEINKM